jgi:hypothetical protein
MCSFSKPLIICRDGLDTLRIAQSFSDVWELAYDPILEFKINTPRYDSRLHSFQKPPVQHAASESNFFAPYISLKQLQALAPPQDQHVWMPLSIYRWHEGQTALSSDAERETIQPFLDELAETLLERGYHDVRQAECIKMAMTPAQLTGKSELKRGQLDHTTMSY